MATVFILSFVEDRDEKGVDLLVGVYHTREKAKAAIEQVKVQPGFRDSPDGFFRINEQQMDETGYTEGFVRA